MTHRLLAMGALWGIFQTQISINGGIMIPSDWARYPNFPPDSPHDNWGDPNMIHELLVCTIQDLRNFIGLPIYINRGYDLKCSVGSQHQFGTAVDCRCPRLSLFDFFIAASRFPAFRGIGVCPGWNPSPGGLHLDVRMLHSINHPRALWGWKDGRQVPLDISMFQPRGGFW